MHLSPESLEAFVQAVSLGSFSAAARKLGKSQSTVSEAIARLEIDLGLELFDRSGRQPQLTEADAPCWDGSRRSSAHPTACAGSPRCSPAARSHG